MLEKDVGEKDPMKLRRGKPVSTLKKKSSFDKVETEVR